MVARFKKPGTVLIVDDEPLIVRALKRNFERFDWTVKVAASKSELGDALSPTDPELAVIDLVLQCGESGIDIVQELSRKAPSTRCVVLTGHGTVAAAVAAMQNGAATVLSKPKNAQEILDAVRDAEEKCGEFIKRRGSLAHQEREHIERVLAECGGSKSEAARRLGIDRRSVQRKLSKRPPSDG